MLNFNFKLKYDDLMIIILLIITLISNQNIINKLSTIRII